MMAASMESHCLRASELPHTSKLYSKYLEDFPSVARFYSHPPSEEGLLASAHEARVDAATRGAVVEILREQNGRLGADAAAFRNLDRLAAGALAIVSGQQVGLFSGPAYSFYKAITALRVAQHLTDLGVDAVPIFWMATEDHDLAEVNHTHWLGRSRALQRLDIPPSPEAVARPVGEVPLGDSVMRAVESAAQLMDGPGASEISAALAEAYSPAQTYGFAFGRLLTRLLAGRGLVVLDPLEPRLHRLGAEIYRRALAESGELADALLARGKQLDRGAFHSQVKVTESSTLLFVRVDGQRVALRRRSRDFVAGRKAFSAAELNAMLAESPESFSANVLLRAVVQDVLLPTAAYIAGPAETAYFAQGEVIYRRLLGRMPVILPRAGFTLVEPHVARLLKKYRLELPDLLRGRQHLRRKLERECLPPGLARKFAAGEKDLQKLLRGLRAPVGKLDMTLLGALDTAERKMLYQFLKLRARAGRAQNFRTGVLDAHERMLLDALFPHHGPQERSLNLLPFLARHGLGLLDELLHRTHVRNSQHQVLHL